MTKSWKPKILIAEDDLDCSDTIRYGLEHKMSCDVTVAMTAYEVVDFLETGVACNNPFNIWVLDLEMPRRHGNQRLEKLGLLLLKDSAFNSRYVIGGPEIIVFSGHSGNKDRQEALSLGVSRFVAKENDDACSSGILNLINEVYEATLRLKRSCELDA